MTDSGAPDIQLMDEQAQHSAATPSPQRVAHDQASQSVAEQKHRTVVANTPKPTKELVHLLDVNPGAELPYVPETWQGSFVRFCAQPPSGVAGDQGSGCETYDTAAYKGSDLWGSVCPPDANGRTCWPAGGWTYTATSIPGGGVSYHHDDRSLLVLGSEFTVSCVPGRGCTSDAPQAMLGVIVPPEFAAEDGIAIAASDGSEITGFTSHGIDRVIGDNAGRAGTTPRAILDALKNPTKITQGIDNLGRPYKIYAGSDARVVINPETGQVISVNPLSGAGASQ